MLTRFFLKKCIWILMKFYKMNIFDKLRSWQSLFVVLTLVYFEICLKKRVNIESNKVNSCDFSVSGSVC